jgi:hypothetical protein
VGPLAGTREGEGPGSRTRAPQWQEAEQGWDSATAMFGMTTRSRGREQQRSSRSKSARNKLDGSGERLPSEGCGKRKKAKLDGISRRVSSVRSSKKRKSRQDWLEKKAKKRNRGEEEDDGSCSSAVSSPLLEPYMPDGTDISKPIDNAISDKYRDMQEEYYAKIGLRFKSLDLRHILKFLYSSYTI